MDLSQRKVGVLTMLVTFHSPNWMNLGRPGVMGKLAMGRFWSSKKMATRARMSTTTEWLACGPSGLNWTCLAQFSSSKGEMLGTFTTLPGARP